MDRDRHQIDTPPWQRTRRSDPPWEQLLDAARDDRIMASPESAAAPPIHQPCPPARDLLDALQCIWDWGGWDARVAPHETWLRVHGDQPWPSPDVWATLPTFGPLDPYLRDPGVTDFHLNMPGARPSLRRNGDAVELEAPERWHPEWSGWLVNQCLQRGTGTRHGCVAEGVVDATVPGERPCTMRYLILDPPLCPHGPAIVLRMLRHGRLQMSRLAELRTFSNEMGELLVCAMRANVDIYVVGPPGVGKTTLAQALIDAVADYRLVCLEDVAELVLAPTRTVRLTLPRGHPTTFSDLVRFALRMNPQRLVIGEVRGSEAYAALVAASNGFPILTTTHGDHAAHGIQAFAIKAAQAPEVQGRFESIYAMLNARPALVVALTQRMGRRQVGEIGEILRQSSNGRPMVEQLYVLDEDGWRRSAPPSTALQRALDSVAGLDWRR